MAASIIAATLCYVQRGRQTLMLHRIKKKNDLHLGKWNGLGGKFEQGETPQDCVVREVREESGLKIKNPQLRGLLTFPQFDGKNDWLVFAFTAPKFSGRLIECNEGHLAWIDNQKILDLPLWEGDQIFLPWILAHPPKKFFTAQFTYKNGRLKHHQVKFY